MSSRSKGSMTELKGQRELEADGWKCIRARGSFKFNKNVDFFGLWDVIGLKLSLNYPVPITLIKCVQFKTNKRVSKEFMQLVKEFKESLGNSNNVQCMAWTYWKRGIRKKKQGFERIIL